MNISKTELIAKASERQNSAAKIDHSVWVSASAGTGKTHVLTKRILRLLMADHTLLPSQILAVTFTRAASREMAVRIRDSVAEWQKLDDAELVKFLAGYLSRTITDADLRRARTLFVTILDEPVNTNTIHGLCQQILGKFPVEAGLSPQFKLIDDKESARLLQEAQGRIFSQVLKGTYAHMWAFGVLSNHMADSTLAEALNGYVSQELRYRRLIRSAGGVEGLLAKIADTLDIEEGAHKDPAGAEAKLYNALIAPNLSRYAALANAVRNVGVKMDTLARYIDEERYDKVFIDYKGMDKLPEKALVKKLSHLCDEYADLQVSALRYIERKKQLKTYLLTSAYIYLGASVAEEYGNLKAPHVDFDDLIMKASETLKHSDWVRYKMDTRTQHVLLDEAQDTDAEQWSIVQNIVNEFYAGTGQSERARTFFAVGDIKQSIYRFRGAQPHVFADMRTYLQGQHANGHKITVAELIASFRSTEPILNFVDMVFEKEHRHKAVDSVAETIKHQAIQIGSGGIVELWPVEEKPEASVDDSGAWALPTAQLEKEDVRTNLAKKVADHIQGLLSSSEVLEVTGKHICPQDIIILLRSRRLMPLLVAELDKRAIPHSGADKVNLAQDNVIQDILACIKYVTNTEDMLSLVHVLRSPLIGLTTEEVAALAPKFNRNLPAEIHSKLQRLVEASKYISPYALVTALLTDTQARGAYYQMRSADNSKKPNRSVDDAIDMVLNAVLDWQNAGNGSLIGFVDFFEKEQGLLKREISAESGVRLLTAHGSKGLEAPIVYMPDATDNYNKSLSREKILWKIDKNDADELCLYKQSAVDASKVEKKLIEDEEKRVFKDEMRLLYVALTRAKERLYIGGVDTGENTQSWYSHIVEALEKNVKTEPLLTMNDDGLWRYAKNVKTQAEVTEIPLETTETHLPSWAMVSAEKESTVHVVQGSEAGGKMVENPFAFTKEADKKLFERGRVMHKLLEVLPEVDESMRKAKAMSFLSYYDFSDAEKRSLINAAEDVFKRYPQFFDESSRAEVELSTSIGRTRLEGKMDRLMVTDTDVVVLDYKTNKEVPDVIPQHYTEQLHHYMRALKEIFPNHNIKGGIIWTSALPVRLDWV